MKAQYRDIMKHSGVYGFGQLLSRLASVLLLPLYTRYLTPTDYGIIAILDLTIGVFAVLIGAGLTAALSRYHFEAADRDEENTVWWTGLIVVTIAATVMIVPAYALRAPLAEFTLGGSERAGGHFYALALSTLWCGMIGNVPNQYLRVRKWSWLFVALSMGGLLLNIVLNVYFLVALQMGVAGVLVGNLITGVLLAAIRVAIVVRATDRPRFSWPIAVHLWRFGSPIIVTALLALFMHQADRYLLRLFLDLDHVGVYSLAYTIGQGLNAFLMVPFSAIWGVVIYDIAKEPGAKRVFARAFEVYVYAMLLFLLGVSLFIKPVLALFAPAGYGAAAGLVPIVCLSFVFYSLDEHFRVPALLAKRTVSLLPASIVGVVANIALNVLFVPRFGTIAAAWASVATYAVFAAVNLAQNRKIEQYNYRLSRCALVLGAMILSFIGCQYLETHGAMRAYTAAAAVWITWAVLLLYMVRWDQFRVARLTTAS